MLCSQQQLTVTGSNSFCRLASLTLHVCTRASVNIYPTPLQSWWCTHCLQSLASVSWKHDALVVCNTELIHLVVEKPAVIVCGSSTCSTKQSNRHAACNNTQGDSIWFLACCYHIAMGREQHNPSIVYLLRKVVYTEDFCLSMQIQK